MKSITLLMTFSVTGISAYPVCPTKAYKAGYDLAEEQFDKRWDNDCQQLDDIYKHVLLKSPHTMLKCQKRGYYDGAESVYEKYSVKCFPTCAGNGKTMGKKIGKQFCDSSSSSEEDTPICNIVEENACMDTFFDYAFENCNEKRVDDLSMFDEYLSNCNNHQKNFKD